eukprot:COSAG02_NODE_3437_length_6745_cov_3.078694_2_plen_125_part_00
MVGRAAAMASTALPNAGSGGHNAPGVAPGRQLCIARSFCGRLEAGITASCDLCKVDMRRTRSTKRCQRTAAVETERNDDMDLYVQNLQRVQEAATVSHRAAHLASKKVRACLWVRFDLSLDVRG